MIMQMIAAVLATISFSVLFSTPRKEFVYCGITGMIGWFFYLIFYNRYGSVVFATFIGAIAITFLSRLFAVNRRVPVIVFLIAGIFPLVPGTGIYYLAYYAFMNELSLSGYYGREASGIALAIAFGIMIVFLIPQKLFNYRRKKKKADNLIRKWY